MLSQTFSNGKNNSENSFELTSSDRIQNSECTCESSGIPLNNNLITKNDKQGAIELDELVINEDLPMEFKFLSKDLLNKYRLVCVKPDEKIGVTNKMSYKIQ